MHWPLLAFWIFLCARVMTTTIISTYNDDECTNNIIGPVNSPETGECQENSLGIYNSFYVTVLESLCAGAMV